MAFLQRRFPGFILSLIVILFNMACAGQAIQSCLARPTEAPKQAGTDATVLPRRSFAVVTVTSTFSENVCDKKKACKRRTETTDSTASGSFILRSDRDPRVAYVLTAKHACSHKDDVMPGMKHDETDFMVYDFYGHGHRAEFLFSSDEFDLCILSVRFTPSYVQIAPVAMKMPEPGERVYSIAAPKAFFEAGAPLILEGIYSGLTNDGRPLFSVPAAPGSSGAAVFNTRGEIISILLSVPFQRQVIAGREMRVPIIDSIVWGSQIAPIIGAVTSLRTVDEIFGTSLPRSKDSALGGANDHGPLLP